MGALDYDECEPHFAIYCPICRQRYDLDVDGVKPFMASFAPKHVKEMRCGCPDDCGKTFLITHRACSEGCYQCPESSLDIDLIGVHGHNISSEGELSEAELSQSTK